MTYPGGRRVTGWVALAAGLGASATGIVLAVTGARPAADVGVLPAATTSIPAISPSPAVPAAAPVTGWAAPTRITIGALHVDAPVQPVGVGPGGQLVIPGDPGRLGWWIGSAAPGSPAGTVLLAGHVDTAAQGPGALFRLERMPMGSTITVRAGGREETYRAVARRSYPKQHLPATLFQAGGPPQLALVTCGGTFHHGTYSHNVVVYASPGR